MKKNIYVKISHTAKGFFESLEVWPETVFIPIVIKFSHILFVSYIVLLINDIVKILYNFFILHEQQLTAQ